MEGEITIKRILKNLSYSFLANFATMLVSIIVVFIIPTIWGEKAYGYVQLYYFYLGYIGFCQLGWIDGIYLKIGGQQYTKLDTKLYATQFWILCIFEITISIVLSYILIFRVPDIDKRFVVLISCICIVLYTIRMYFIYIFQATNRIKEYALVILSEKIVFSVALLTLCITKAKDYRLIIYVDLLAKIVSMSLSMLFGKDLLKTRIGNITITIKEIINNISIGSKIMIADFAGLLITGIVRFAIENYWDIIIFGKLSMSLSVSSMIMTFITAISIAFFPIIKQMSNEIQKESFIVIRNLLILFLFVILIFYYPAQFFLGIILPTYKDSFTYLIITLPMCIFESKMSVLLITYLKVLRKEKQILYINVFSVILSLIFTFFTVYIFHSFMAAIVSLVIISAIRNYITEFYLSKILNIKLLKDNLLESILILFFILAFWNMNNSIALILYIISLLIYIYIKKKDIKLSLLYFRRKSGYV